MAKKSRTPPPPRRVQAPKQRTTPRTHEGLSEQRKRWILYGVAGAGVVGVIVAIALIASAGGSKVNDKGVAAALRAAGCTFVTKPVLPPKNKKNFHADVPTLTTKVKWSTFPPSGGAHYGLWAIWGFYQDPVNPRQVVHNEEHGGAILWWGPKVPQATIDKLHTFYSESPAGMFGTPIAGLGDKIALTAWTGDPQRYYQNGYYGVGHLTICPRFDEAAFKKFRDAYRGHGPEGVPLSADQPGSGPNG